MSLCQDFEKSQLIQTGSMLRRICKDCLKHYNPKDADHNKYLDCKNVFYDKDGKQRGQCECYAKEHGLRKVVE